MTNVLLIDLSSIAHPIFHIESDPQTVSTKVVERVRALASGNPHVGICVEGGRSFRKDLDPSYKANRPESDAALYHQIDLAIDILRADGFPILRADGFEADDVIATADFKMTAMPLSVTIASADKDLLQLVNGAVLVKSLKDGSLIDAAAVEAKFGVRPNQMLDYLALVGDTSDNIKGCNGVGKTRAAGLLKKCGTLDQIYNILDNTKGEFTETLAAALNEFRPRVESVRNLLRLRTDAPIDVSAILKERVPADVAEFGAEENEDNSQTAADVATVTSPTTDNGMRPSVPNGADSGHQTMNGHALAVIEPTPIEWERQLEPRNMAQMKTLAADLFASRLFSAYGHPAGVLSTILAGRELGLPAMAALRAFHVIDGKPCMAADFIRALVLQSGVVEYFRCSERTDAQATFVAKRKGEPELSLTFTVEDGKRAWSKSQAAWDASGWGRNPADMCVARAGSKLARLVAPDVVSGLYAREELE